MDIFFGAGARVGPFVPLQTQTGPDGSPRSATSPVLSVPGLVSQSPQKIIRAIRNAPAQIHAMLAQSQADAEHFEGSSVLLQNRANAAGSHEEGSFLRAQAHEARVMGTVVRALHHLLDMELRNGANRPHARLPLDGAMRALQLAQGQMRVAQTYAQSCGARRQDDQHEFALGQALRRFEHGALNTLQNDSLAALVALSTELPHPNPIGSGARLSAASAGWLSQIAPDQWQRIVNAQPNVEVLINTTALSRCYSNDAHHTVVRTVTVEAKALHLATWRRQALFAAAPHLLQVLRAGTPTGFGPGRQPDPSPAMIDCAAKAARLLRHVEQLLRAQTAMGETVQNPATTGIGNPIAERVRRGEYPDFLTQNNHALQHGFIDHHHAEIEMGEAFDGDYEDFAVLANMARRTPPYPVNSEALLNAQAALGYGTPREGRRILDEFVTTVSAFTVANPPQSFEFNRWTDDRVAAVLGPEPSHLAQLSDALLAPLRTS